MTTAGDIIKLALKDAGQLGVGQNPLAEDVTDALLRLNMMLAQWRRKRWLVYHLVEVVIPATGSSSYGLGPDFPYEVYDEAGLAWDQGGLRFDQAPFRPDRIETAFARLPSALGVQPPLISPSVDITTQQPNTGLPIDYPLVVLQSREDYNRIALKSLVSFPRYCFLDQGFPNATLYVWPAPYAGFTVHVFAKDMLQQFEKVSDPVNLPPEYLEAILYNLGVRLRAAYNMPADPTVIAMAKASLNTLRMANAAVPRLQMPRDLGGGYRGSIYDGWSA